MEPLLKAEHLTVCYNGVPAVRDVSFQLKEGEILGIVGESGSGKSTILRAVLGLLGKAGRLTQGNIWYRGKNLTELTEKQMRLFRGPEIGTVFQDSKSALCPVRTIGAQIYEAMRAHERVSKKESWRRAGEMLEKIGLKRLHTGEFFHEFVTTCDKTQDVLDALDKAGILGGLPVEGGILWCVTEMVSRQELDRAVAIIKEVC